MSHKKIIFISVLLSCFLFFVHTCSAIRPTEVIYPSIPGVTMTPVTVKTLLPEYARYMFNLVVAIGGFICFGSFVYAGVRRMTSGGSPLAMKDANSQILSAFIGMIIVLTSYLVSKTINPQLVIPQISIESVGGITLGTSPCDQDKNEPGGERKTFITNSPDFGEMSDNSTDFKAMSLKFNSAPGKLEVVLFDNPEYEGSRLKITSGMQDCFNISDAGGLTKESIKLFWQLSGVYLCNDTYDDDWICNGEERLLPCDTALLNTDFDDKVKGIRFKDATKQLFFLEDCEQCIAEDCCYRAGGYRIDDGDACYCMKAISEYGAVLHEDADWRGECEVFIHKKADLTSEDPANYIKFGEALPSATTIEDKASSVTTFILGKGGSGGVWFCPEPNSERENCIGPVAPIVPLLVTGDGGMEVTTLDGQNHVIENDDISSIIIDGRYLVVMFKDKNFEGKCQVFTRSDSNFLDDPIGKCGYSGVAWEWKDCLSSFMIIPTKGND